MVTILVLVRVVGMVVVLAIVFVLQGHFGIALQSIRLATSNTSSVLPGSIQLIKPFADASLPASMLQAFGTSC